MPKFKKGAYLFTLKECEEIVRAYLDKKYVQSRNKVYIALKVVPKSANIEKETFEAEVLKHTKKKSLCDALKTSYFKLETFIIDTYGTSDLAVIRNQISSCNSQECQSKHKDDN